MSISTRLESEVESELNARHSAAGRGGPKACFNFCIKSLPLQGLLRLTLDEVSLLNSVCKIHGSSNTGFGLEDWSGSVP